MHTVGVGVNENTTMGDMDDRAAFGLNDLVEEDLMLPKMDHNRGIIN